MYKTEFQHHSGKEKLILLSDTWVEAQQKRPKFPGFEITGVEYVDWGPLSNLEKEVLKHELC